MEEKTSPAVPDEQAPERAILVAADLGAYDAETSLDELEELARTAGIEPVARLIQRRERLDKATAIGAGKLAELRAFAETGQATLLLFDDELTGMQTRNLEERGGLPVLDRTMLILRIFAARARSHEGRLQVELACNRYLLPRLAGMGTALSRLGGGGGAAGAGARRGKGETKLELDRRHLRRRITALEAQLGELAARRELIRRRRRKDSLLTVAIVGYTNVGKSTLLNALTGAGALAEDKLFATLDPTARALSLPDGRTVLLVDTVGLVRRLPHHLVRAFRSTLEEAARADLLLNVCDISSPEYAAQLDVTAQLLAELGAAETPVLTVLNKADRLAQWPEAPGRNTAVISAATGRGLPGLLARAAALLPPTSRRLRLLIPYDKGSLTADIRREGVVYEEQFRPDGIFLDALVDHKVLGRVQSFVTEQ